MTCYVPAVPGTQAVFHVTGGKAVLRSVVAWRMTDLSTGHAQPVTMVREGALPSEPEQLPVVRACVFPGGRVVSVDGSRAWPSLDEYCTAKLLVLVDS